MALPDFTLAEATTTTNTNSTHRRPFYAHYFQHPLQSTNLAEMQYYYHNNSANLMQRNFPHKEMEVFLPNYSNSALPRQLLGGSGCSSFVPKCSSTSTSALPPNIGSSQEKHHPINKSSTEEDKEEGEGKEGSLTTRAEITSAFSQPTRKRTMQKPDSKNAAESEDSSITKRQKCSSRKPCEQLRGKAFTTKGSKSPLPDCKNSSASPTSKDSNKQSKSGGAAVTQDYVHVRARRGQATDSHSLAERVRREKISERMRFLQDLVPGCNKAIGKAMMLDEIINYVQSLQHQVEFLSMKLAALSPRMDFDINSLLIGEMMLLNGATTNLMATTTIGSGIAETVQMGNMCDMVYNPSASNMSFQMLLQSPLPPDNTNIGDPTSLPIKACENAMLNNANLAINLDQSYMDPQLTSTWDPRSMPGRENMVFYSNPTVSVTEPVGNPLV